MSSEKEQLISATDIEKSSRLFEAAKNKHEQSRQRVAEQRRTDLLAKLHGVKVALNQEERDLLLEMLVAARKEDGYRIEELEVELESSQKMVALTTQELNYYKPLAESLESGEKKHSAEIAELRERVTQQMETIAGLTPKVEASLVEARTKESENAKLLIQLRDLHLQRDAPPTNPTRKGPKLWSSLFSSPSRGNKERTADHGKPQSDIPSPRQDTS